MAEFGVHRLSKDVGRDYAVSAGLKVSALAVMKEKQKMKDKIAELISANTGPKSTVAKIRTLTETLPEDALQDLDTKPKDIVEVLSSLPLNQSHELMVPVTQCAKIDFDRDLF